MKDNETMTYEIAFDAVISVHEFIKAAEAWDAEELADRLLESPEFRERIIGKLRRELDKNPYIEAECVGNGTGPASISWYEIGLLLSEED